MLYKVKTAGGVEIQYEQHPLTYEHAIEPLIDKLDSQRVAIIHCMLGKQAYPRFYRLRQRVKTG
jgi:hypothetical protein